MTRMEIHTPHAVSPLEKLPTNGSLGEIRGAVTAATQQTRGVIGDLATGIITVLPSIEREALQAKTTEQRQLSSRFGAWITNSEKTGIRPQHINPDGSLKLDEIRQLDYFKERSTLLDAYEGFELSTSSKTRRQAAILGALATADKPFRPSPIPREPGPEIPKREMNRIFETARGMGLNPVDIAEKLGKNNHLGTFRRAYAEAYSSVRDNESSKVGNSNGVAAEDTDPHTYHNGSNGHNPDATFSASVPVTTSFLEPPPTNGHQNGISHAHDNHHETHDGHNDDGQSSSAEHSDHRGHDQPVGNGGHEAIKSTPREQGRFGRWRDKRTAFRRAEKNEVLVDNIEEKDLIETITQEFGDVRDNLSRRQQRRYDRLTSEQKTIFAEQIAAQKLVLYKDKPVISRAWQFGTIAGNAVIGTAEIFTGNVSTLSVTADGLHNAGDAVTYGIQTQNILNPKLSEERRAKRRKVAHAIIAGVSLGVAAKAGYDLSFDEETIQDPITIYAAGASLALNSLLMATLYRGINRKKREGTLGPHEKDLTKHLWAIDVPSAALAVGGVVAQRYGVDDIESAAAIVSGLVGAYAFRPTRSNLDHSGCAKHGDHSGHGHGHHEHGKTEHTAHEEKIIHLHGRHEREKEVEPPVGYVERHNDNAEDARKDAGVIQSVDKKKRTRRGGRFLAAAATIVALGAGIAGIGKITNSSESPEKADTASSIINPPSIAEGAPISPDVTQLPTPLAQVVYEQIDEQVDPQPSDSFWKIGERQLETVPGPNWESPYGSSRNDVIIDFSRDLGGVDVESLSQGYPVSLAGNLSQENKAIIAKIAETDSYEDYQTNVDQLVKDAYAA